MLRRLVFALALLAGAAEAFVAPRASSSARALHAEDPTKVWYAEIANTVQNLLTNSPLNEGKKAVVKMLAGPYDEVAAKQLVDAKGAKYTVVELDEVSDGPALRAELGGLVGRTSVPAIWIQSDFVGGCNDGPGIITLDKQGELDARLKAAGAL
ncbi:protein disulfide oxidoreductase [Aureococcus anophagefferens]|nr:protein disulfide oxidoreductase [Aureococcus anophagefferens]